MTRIETIRGAIECSLSQGRKCLYLSHPVTTGGRPMHENIAMAAELAGAMRRTSTVLPVVNPTGIGHIDGWDHDKWMDLWLPFIRDRASAVIMAPGWEASRGCSLERICALNSGIRVTDYRDFIRFMEDRS